MRETVRLLEPTLVISQGVNLSKPLHMAECRMRDQKFVWADLRHPTFNWDWLSRPYLQNVVGPTLREARRLALDPG
jgi:hypothetical protein